MKSSLNTTLDLAQTTSYKVFVGYTTRFGLYGKYTTECRSLTVVYTIQGWYKIYYKGIWLVRIANHGTSDKS